METVRKLTSLSDADIARILNMKKTTTPRGLRWNQTRVQQFRRQHRIKATPEYDDGKHLTKQQVEQQLGIGVPIRHIDPGIKSHPSRLTGTDFQTLRT